VPINCGTRAREVSTIAAKEDVSDELNTVAFSHNGKLLAAGYRSATLRAFTVDPSASTVLTEVEVPPAGFTSWVNTLAFSPDDTELVAGSSDSSLKTWRVDGWEETRRSQVPAPVTGAGYLRDGRDLIAVSFDGTTRIWDTTRSPMAGPRANVFAIGFDTTGSRLAVFPGRADGTIELWDTSTLPSMIPVNDRIAGPTEVTLDGTGVLLPGGTHAIGGTAQGPLQLWDLRGDTTKSNGPVAQLDGPTDLIEFIAVNATGTLLAASSDDRFIHLWDTSDPANPKRLPATTQLPEFALGLEFHPTEPVLAIAGADDHAYLWRYEGSNEAPVEIGAFGNDVSAVSFTDDGSLLAASGAEGTVEVWDTTDLSKPRRIETPLAGPQNSVYEMDFQPGTRLLAGAVQDGSVWIWDLTNPEKPITFAALRASTAAVNTVQFSQDGRFLIGVGSGKRIYVWELDPTAVADWICKNTGDELTANEWKVLLPDVKPRALCPKI